MATQRLMVTTLAGQSAVAVSGLFEKWRSVLDPEAVDRLCLSIRENALSLSIVYFSEWVDRWLMGDLAPGPGAVEGRRFQATCLSTIQAKHWAERCGSQFVEQGWLASRLREAAAGWGDVAEPYSVVVVREVVDASALDDDVRAVAASVPVWLLSHVNKDAANGEGDRGPESS